MVKEHSYDDCWPEESGLSLKQPGKHKIYSLFYIVKTLQQLYVCRDIVFYRKLNFTV
jgi:hypothetical protein